VNNLDSRDWAPGTNDAFNQFSDFGVVNPVSHVDLQVMDVIGFDYTDQAIAWGPSIQYDTGGPNAVALDDQSNAVEVHVGTNRLFYRVVHL
jgi:hypothetical protein